MGKSTAAQMFRSFKIKVHDADATVHRLMKPGTAATKAIAKLFPDVMTGDGVIDRVKLGQKVFANDQALKSLEAILHPLVRLEERKFLRRAAVRREKLVVLDIPLLYETKGEKRCDGVAVVSAPKYIQVRRVLSRPHMTLEKLNNILARQLPDLKKRHRADFIIPTGMGLRYSRTVIRGLIDDLISRNG